MAKPKPPEEKPPKSLTVNAVLLGMGESHWTIEGSPEHQRHVADKLYVFWQPLIESWEVVENREGTDSAVDTRVADSDRGGSDRPGNDAGGGPDDAGR